MFVLFSDRLINEMLYIKQLRPRLNVQSDSIRAKVFVQLRFLYVNLSDFKSFQLALYSFTDFLRGTQKPLSAPIFTYKFS